MKKLILLSGKARSGKNTFANLLSEEFKKQNLIIEQDAFTFIAIKLLPATLPPTL